MRRALLPALALIVVLATASGCGEDDPTAGGTGAETASETPSETPTETSSESPSETASESPSEDSHDSHNVEIEVEIEGGSVTPNGERVEVGVGQPVEFVVEADAAGSLHVHSSPEHDLDYDAGTTTFPPLTFDRPGVVEVESHEAHAVVVQLEVR